MNLILLRLGLRFSGLRSVIRRPADCPEFPNPDSEIQGNLQAALLRFGDQKTAGQVATELNSFAPYPGYFPFEAIRKLRFAGGKTAVGVLVDGLGSANRIGQDAQKEFDACL